MQTLCFMYSLVSLSPFKISLHIFIALLILWSLRLTKLPKDFLALDFLTLDLKALNAALFLLDPERFVLWSPADMANARAPRLATSLSSSGVFKG